MPIDTIPNSEDFFPALLGEFVEIRENVSQGDFWIIGAIRVIVQEKINQITDKKTEEKKIPEFQKIISEAKEIEEEIIQRNSSFLDKKTGIGLIRFWIDEGDKLENPFFQNIVNLYKIRYGEKEMKKLVEIFRNKDNNDRYFLYIEFGKAYDGVAPSIRKMYLWDTETYAKEKKNTPWKESEIFISVA